MNAPPRTQILRKRMCGTAGDRGANLNTRRGDQAPVGEIPHVALDPSGACVANGPMDNKRPQHASFARRAAAVLAWLTLAASGTVAAQATASLAPVDPQTLSQFGLVLSQAGTRIAVASPTADAGAGRVDVFECSAGCQHEAAIQPLDLVAGDRFGAALALSADELFVSAYHFDTGRVYVYTRSGANWSLNQVLTPSNGEDEDRFGVALSLDGTRLAVGAERGLGGEGAVYVFDKQAGSWSESASFNTDNGQDDDAFGHAVALQGDRLLVGAPWYDADGIGTGWGQGAVFVFERVSASSWNLVQQLPVPGVANGWGFGYSLAAQGNLAVVGAPGADGDRGAVQAYLHNGAAFALEAALDADRGVGERAGMRLALQADQLLSAAPLFAQDCGRVRRYLRTGIAWNEVFMPSSQVMPGIGRGWSLAFDGQTAWVGLPSRAQGGFAQAGAVVAVSVMDAVFADGMESLELSCQPPA